VHLTLYEDNVVSIAKAGAIPLLVALLQKSTDLAKENAATLLWGLAALNEVSIARAGAIPTLVALLQYGGTNKVKNLVAS